MHAPRDKVMYFCESYVLISSKKYNTEEYHGKFPVIFQTVR